MNKQKSPVIVRNVAIGEGIPKVIVPVVGVSRDEILESVKKIADSPAQLVEWRADWYESVSDRQQVISLAGEIRQILGDRPLLFTFRTSREGGNQAITPEDYAGLIQAVAASKTVDLVDLELFFGDDFVKSLVDECHKCDVKVVISNHDFSHTPDAEVLFERLRKMYELGADLPKIAVMPKTVGDVLALLAVTDRANAELPVPVITMSMGGLGVVSRMAGEIFGSALTFGSLGQASAPGQVAVGELQRILQMIHGGLIE